MIEPCWANQNPSGKSLMTILFICSTSRMPNR